MIKELCLSVCVVCGLMIVFVCVRFVAFASYLIVFGCCFGILMFGSGCVWFILDCLVVLLYRLD